MNKKQASAKLNDLELEVAKLRKIIEGDDIFSVTSYEEVCSRLGRPVLSISNFSFLPTIDQQKKALYHHYIKNLEDFFNEGWVPNWTDHAEYKYYLWYEYKKAGGWVFRGVVYYFGSSGRVGFYKSREVADHVQKYFNNIYINYLG